LDLDAKPGEKGGLPEIYDTRNRLKVG
jgi:hypothetical protein